ncbi:MAG TPA: NlpC/P60 family protein [Bacteriovoracaceae bacterium]|nr:NlpC/P60 family protein [Bacteriovoracaceae bacterium]
MVRIEKSQWLPQTYCEAREFHDVIRSPESGYQGLGPKEKDKLRQFQVARGEVLRTLGHHQEFSLVMRFDGSIGWIPSGVLTVRPEIRELSVPQLPRMSSEEFFQKWLGVQYVWGGVSEQGIDCSGFTQLYYLQVLGTVLPKNSHDQKKWGHDRTMESLQDHDLIFCFRKDKVGTHHVVIYYQGNCWHARRSKGVVAQSVAEFVVEFNVVAVRQILPVSRPQEF